jgi:hypothetical protein
VGIGKWEMGIGKWEMGRRSSECGGRIPNYELRIPKGKLITGGVKMIMTDDERYRYEERAANCEFDGGLTREEFA